MITVIIHTRQFSDPSAEAAFVDIMLKRRDKILRAFLPAVNPVVSPRLLEAELTFDNAAVNADVAKAPRRRPLGESSSRTNRLPEGPPTLVASRR